MRERVIDTSLHQVTSFRSTADFLATDVIPAGISTIWEGGLPIDLLISPASSPTTVFFFHGAINHDFVLPVLSGVGVSGTLSTNRVFISDPSLVLDESLMLAWYAGNSKQPRLQKTLTDILKKVAMSLGTRRTVFFGGSGGGFASLFFASQFHNSLALVFNPQTNIAKYSAAAVQDFAVKAFGIQPELPDPLKYLPHEVVTDICEIYSAPKNVTVAYMQNCNDLNHIKSHLEPFEQAVHSATNFMILQEPWAKGHSPPPKDLLAKALNVAGSSANWSQGFQALGFSTI